MAGVTVKFDARLNRIFRSNELMREAIRRGLEQAAKEGLTQLGLRTPRRSGALARAEGYEMKSNGLGFVIGVIKSEKGKKLAYANFRDKGGTIVPHKKKMLAWALPGNPTVTEAGVSGISAGAVRRDPSQYKFHRTFIMRSRRNPSNLVVVETLQPPVYRQTGGVRTLVQRGQYRPLWVLAPSVTQEGSGYFTDTIGNANYRQFVVDQVAASVTNLFASLSVGAGLRSLGA